MRCTKRQCINEELKNISNHLLILLCPTNWPIRLFLKKKKKKRILSMSALGLILLQINKQFQWSSTRQKEEAMASARLGLPWTWISSTWMKKGWKKKENGSRWGGTGVETETCRKTPSH